MPDGSLRTYVYWVLRYVPNLVRDESVNIGILLYDPLEKRIGVRIIEDPREFARVRRLHPNVDIELLRALHGEFEARIAEHHDDPEAYIRELEENLSNALQLSPRKGLLAERLDLELGRLYREQVEPPYRGQPVKDFPETRPRIRARITEVFRSAGVLNRMEQSVAIEQFTYKDDPLRLDYAYWRNRTRGFLHALTLSRDPAQAKVLAYTADRIRAKLPEAEFTAVTEIEPRPDNRRHQFVARLLTSQAITILPIADLDEFATQLRPALGGGGPA